MKQNDQVKQKKLNAESTLYLIADLRSKETLMEEILSRDNMFKALDKVLKKKGCAGIDGMEVSELKDFLKENWLKIKGKILEGSYKPLPVLQVEIPKSTGGKRQLGIPVVLDRLIQQAIMQVLQNYIDPTFSPLSYGFRPARSAHQAVLRGKEYMNNGREQVVDIDLEKYFDTVNHDKLMSMLKSLIADQRVLNLIRKYLNTGIDIDERRVSGVPQGSPLSPLLSNIYLNVLDKELEKRGHAFVRYADDCKIFVRSAKAAERVMRNTTHYLVNKLKLKVNAKKSGISQECKFLGYIISKKTLTISKENLQTFKEAIRQKTKKRGGKNIFAAINSLKHLINGWYEYFKLQKDKSVFRSLDSWIRRRLRAYYFCALKTGKNRLKEFLKCRLDYDTAYRFAYTQSGPWRTSKGRAMQTLLSNKRLTAMGLVSLER